MRNIVAKVETLLKKAPKQSRYLEDNQKSKVNKGKVYPVVSIKAAEGNHSEVVLGFGAGTWYIYNPHWEGVQEKTDQPNDKQNNIERIKRECIKQNCTLEQTAYVLATTEWETNYTFLPVREAYWLSERWRQVNLRYYPYYGRGFVQLTWRSNYERYEKILGLPLVSNPDLVMGPDVATFILVDGSVRGVFTGRKLSDYIGNGKVDYINARRVINGTDKAREIAKIAQRWASKLR